MEWLINNWYLIVALLAVVVFVVFKVIGFANLPTDQQIANLKEWLKWAVAQAEAELGTGTGQLKLRMVYDMAVATFGWVAELVPFNTFEVWVDEALEWLNHQLDTNTHINKVVTNSK